MTPFGEADARGDRVGDVEAFAHASEETALPRHSGCSAATSGALSSGASDADVGSRAESKHESSMTGTSRQRGRSLLGDLPAIGRAMVRALRD